MKINTNPFINSVAPGKTDGGVSSVCRVSTSGLDQKSFQDQYTQTKNNLGQINPSKDHNKSASKQLQLLTQKAPTFPPLDQLVLLKDHKPQNAILLTGRIVQHLNPKVWDTFTSSEKLQITAEHLESMCHYLNMDAAELHKTNELKSLYLGESQLESYRQALTSDNGFTHKWLFEKDEIHPHLLIQPQNPVFNAIADSIGDDARWIWGEIGDAHKEHFELFEFDQFYEKQGYIQRSGSMDLTVESIILFGHKKNGIYQLKHAGKINEHGFYQSKQHTGGTLLWPAPIADACEEFGEPLLQYVRKEEPVESTDTNSSDTTA